MKEIGGYFELSLIKHKHYHKGIRLNSGRNAILYIAIANKFKKIYVPSYICDASFSQLTGYGIQVEFYKIDSSFYPVKDFDAQKNEAVLYVNYFGLFDSNSKRVQDDFSHSIIDNSQAFYSEVGKEGNSMYSPRKFFGVPDGSYAYSRQKLIQKKLRKEKDSFKRIAHLMKRVDNNAQLGYSDFLKAEDAIASNELRRMSNLTAAFLQSIDYKKAREIRRENFMHLHSKLKEVNQLRELELNEQTPMCYPLMIPMAPQVRTALLSNKIYTPKYWVDTLSRTQATDFEYRLTNELIPLPIDQRYSLKEMDRILSIITSFYE